MSITAIQQSNLDVSDLDVYYTTLENIFSSIVKKFNKMNLSDHTNQTIVDANILLKKGMSILHSMKSHVKSLEVLLSDCGDFVEEVTEDISIPPKKDEFVYHTSGGMLSYPGRDILKTILTVKADRPSDRPTDTKPTDTKPTPTVERVLLTEIGYYLKLPIVTNLKHIPPALHYFKGNADIPQGVYINLPNNNIVRIPFPEIMDSKREYDRTHSIRCKYHSKDECNFQRSKMAKMHNSQFRTCNFAHIGDKIIKVGYPSRCPSMPDFGNPSTMSSDIKKVNMNDISNMMLYGLNDLICSVVYLDYSSINNRLMHSLEKA